MKSFNLFIDDCKTPMVEFSGTHSEVPDTSWVIARNVDDAKTLLSTGMVKDLAIDNDLGLGETGYDIMKWLENNKEYWPSGIITCVSNNPIGRENIMAVIKRNIK